MASTASMLCLILVTLFSKSPVALHYTDEFPSIRRSLVCLIDFLQAVSARKITPLTWIWFQVPPLGVLMISGCSVDFFINILLTILGWVNVFSRFYSLQGCTFFNQPSFDVWDVWNSLLIDIDTSRVTSMLSIWNTSTTATAVRTQWHGSARLGCIRNAFYKDMMVEHMGALLERFTGLRIQIRMSNTTRTTPGRCKGLMLRWCHVALHIGLLFSGPWPGPVLNTNFIVMAPLISCLHSDGVLRLEDSRYL